MVLIMGFERKKILIEFCNSNTFTDSEDDSSDEELSNNYDIEEHVVTQQPGNDKITIIVDTSNVIQHKEEEHDHDWENIEYTDLEDIVFDYSLNKVIKEKYL